MNAHITLIKQQFSGSLFSRYTSKIKSPAGENWGGGGGGGERKEKKEKWSETERSVELQKQYGRINWLSFESQTPVRNESKWSERRETGSVESKGCFIGGKVNPCGVKNPAE